MSTSQSRPASLKIDGEASGAVSGQLGWNKNFSGIETFSNLQKILDFWPENTLSFVLFRHVGPKTPPLIEKAVRPGLPGRLWDGGGGGGGG